MKKKMRMPAALIMTLMMALTLAAPAFAESAPKVEDVDYDRYDKEVSIDFVGRVEWSGSPKVTITRGGKNLARQRQKVGMVFQSYDLFPHLNVLDNITLAPLKVQKRNKLDAEAEAKELLARVRAMTRRRAEYSSDTMTFGDLSLDASTFELKAENAVRLSVREFELMQMLMRSPGQALDAGQLLSRVWEGEPEADEAALWLYISYLKRKLTAVASSVQIEGSPREGR